MRVNIEFVAGVLFGRTWRVPGDVVCVEEDVAKRLINAKSARRTNRQPGSAIETPESKREAAAVRTETRGRR